MRSKTYIFLTMLLFPLFAAAQPVTITGVVTDVDHNPLPAVSISIKGTTTGAATDVNGRYTIKVANRQVVLVYSYMGYERQEQPVGDRSAINVTLQKSNNALNEVVVIGYGTQHVTAVSSSIASITAKQIENQPVGNIGQALVGQLPGVQVQGTSGSPGTAPVIRIRGIGSLGAGNDPLYVVDGYPLNGSEDFDQINPTDIEKIEVLKDAAAAAIYGSRGGNGVIIVTTKRGKAGKMQLNYNTFVGFDQVAKQVKVLNGPEYIDYIKGALFYPGRTGVVAPSNLNDPSTLYDTNWQDHIFRSGINQSHQLSASGGNAMLKYFMAGSYNNQKGIVLGTGFQRYNFRANVDAQLSPKIKVSFNLAPSFTSRDDRPVSSDQFVNNYFAGMPLSSGNLGVNSMAMVQNALLLSPVLPVKLPNGDYDQSTTDPYQKGTAIATNYFNPVSIGNLLNDRSDAMRLLGNFNLNFEIIKGLQYKLNVGGETFNNRRNVFVPSNMAYVNSPLATFSNPVLNGIVAQQRSNQNYNWLWENTLTYDFKILKDHSFTLLLGYASQKNTSESAGLSSVSGSFASDAIPYISASSNIAGIASKSKNTLISQFTRLNYSYKDKYLLSAAIRRDGSSRFGSNRKYANFPSVSAGWRLSQEDFLIDNKWISELKLRVSHGVTGNNNIGDFAAVATLGQSNYTFGTGAGSAYYGYAPTAFTNPDLTWEINKQTDIGLDVGLLNNRINITADVYERNTNGLLTATPISSLAGFSTTYLRNVGSIRNRGFDLAVGSKNLNGKFKWSTDANFSLNRNKITSYYKSSGDFYAAVFGWNTVFQVQEGGSVGDVYGLVTDGVFKDAAEANAGPKWQTGSAAGDIRFKDQDGDGVITDKDRVVFANTQPRFTYGLTNSFSFKGFDLRIALQGVYGSKVVYAIDRFLMGGGGFYNSSADMLGAWKSAENPGNGWVPRYNASGNSSDFSSRFVRDGSYLRIRNVALSYLLPKSTIKALHITNVRLTLSGQNLYTFTTFPGYNPEVNIEGASVFRTNVDQGGYPFARTLAFGINASF